MNKTQKINNNIHDNQNNIIFKTNDEAYIDRKHVLIIGPMWNFQIGGIESYLLETFRNIDQEILNSFEIRYLIPGRVADAELKRKYLEYGVKVDTFDIDFIKPAYGKKGRIKGYIDSMRMLDNYLKSNCVDVVHINTTAIAYVACMVNVAKRNRIQWIIATSHNMSIKGFSIKEIIRNIARAYISKNADLLTSVSKGAAPVLFGKKGAERALIIKYGVDTKKYEYSEKDRNEIRDIIGAGNKSVIGHVGRFVEQKNHEFLLRVFSKLLDKRPESLLLLIGDGQLKNTIIRKSIELGIRDKILFPLVGEGLEKYYSAMDVFVFPSLYEGLGTVVLEAQSSGLPVVGSDNLPLEARVTDLVQCLSLDIDLGCWVDKICDILEHPNIHRMDYAVKVRESGYDIKDTSKELMRTYMLN